MLDRLEDALKVGFWRAFMRPFCIEIGPVETPEVHGLAGSIEAAAMGY